MIVLQSSWPVTALSRHPCSPEGCGRLAGDDIPGKPPHYPRALKGRGKEFIFPAASSPLRFQVPGFRMPDSGSALMDGKLTFAAKLTSNANQMPADAGQKNFTSLLTLNPPSGSSWTFHPLQSSTLKPRVALKPCLSASLCQPLPRNANLCHAPGGYMLRCLLLPTKHWPFSRNRPEKTLI
jgi:hypothetical protein